MNDLDLQKLFNYLICLHFWLFFVVVTAYRSWAFNNTIIYGHICEWCVLRRVDGRMNGCDLTSSPRSCLVSTATDALTAMKTSQATQSVLHKFQLFHSYAKCHELRFPARVQPSIANVGTHFAWSVYLHCNGSLADTLLQTKWKLGKEVTKKAYKTQIS